MADTQDEDMYLFQSGLEQTPAGFAGSDFDTFLTSSVTEADQPDSSAAFLNPSELSVKREQDDTSLSAADMRFAQSHRDSASSSSSSETSKFHNRNVSEMSATSAAGTQPSAGQVSWGSGVNGFSVPAGEQYFDDSSMTGIDTDFETSNQQMASDFDFETAASTPSGFDPTAGMSMKTPNPIPSYRRTTNFPGFGHVKSSSPRLPASAQPSFYFANSREASPLNAMLPTTQAQSPWSKHSPSSGLEETFNNIHMNGDSPGNATFPPNLQFPGSGFSFDPESSATPSTFTKDISSPPSTINSADGTPHLTVHPTSLKSRVETQIPIKLTLVPLPGNAKKLRLPTHTVSKPKFLAKPELDRSPEILELYTSLVCTSAMQDPVRLDRALARARGEDLAPLTRPSPASSTTSHSSKDDEDKPLNGGEVKICSGCIQRERKRASRKKQKKPEEEELFQKDEEKRVVVFNTNEIKDWTDASQEPSPNGTNNQPHFPPGAMQVELPMRIACYCRHQNEKMGFQVIFTIKDYRDKVIAQALTNPIMITDDHKTHNAPTQIANPPATLPNAPQLPGAGVFSTAGADNLGGAAVLGPKMFKQSFSTTDLQGLQHNFNPSFPMAPASNPFAVPSALSSATSATLTPRNLSRPASPTGLPGPTTKRRKQSGSGKQLPSGLTMTRLDTAQGPSGSATMPNTAASSPFAPTMSSYMPAVERPFNMAPTRHNQYEASPPTPNGNDPTTFGMNVNRSYSLENLPRQAIISAPPSRQPSRPGSPGSARNSFGATDPNFGQAVTNQLMNQPSRRPPPLIHKLVPAEGSVTGGTEVTLLGNGFYQGLEVMFGDTEATTTTFWGEKCLNCIAPPALQPGVVAVVFKHEHPQYATMQPTSQTRTSVFTYTDDRELEMFRLALRTLGKQMHTPTDDPFAAAQQLIQSQQQQQQQQQMWPPPNSYNMGGSGHQRSSGMNNGVLPMDTLEVESVMLQMLQFMDQRKPGVVLDLRRPSGLTLLHFASSLGLTRFVAGLLARGASPDLADNNGHTAMHHAAMNGHTHIIHRLRLAGGNHKARSVGKFTPADLATSLLAYQAVLSPSSHYRSRSVGGTPMRLHSRNASSASLASFWEDNSAYYRDSDSSDTDGEIDRVGTPAGGITERLVTNTEAGSSLIRLPLSRKASNQTSTTPSVQFPVSTVTNDGQSGTPSAFMLAWRDHLVAQLQQFNESAQSVMPSLATFNGPLQALQDYQDYPVVRRVSSLFPQRPSSRQARRRQKEGWWETLTGTSSPVPAQPPAYGDLYPEHSDSQEDSSLKKTSAMQAAADAAADMHFESQEEGVDNKVVKKEVGNKRSASAKKSAVDTSVKRVELSNDRKLFFFWIPILAIVLALMIHNSGMIELIPRPYIMMNRMIGREVVEVL